MVTIVGYKANENKQGEKFHSLVIQGGVEMVQSKETGQFYATARKATISSTFDEATCKSLIGQQMSGNIEKASCEPYDYTVPSTGEVITLIHSYQFVPEGEKPKEVVVGVVH